MQAVAKKSIFGEVLEISAADYVNEVTKAGDGIWVVLHLYKSGSVFDIIIFMIEPFLRCIELVDS